MIYRGNAAKIMLENCLENPKVNFDCGCYFERDKWIAFDNTTGHCWVGEFSTEAMAICWIERLFEISEQEEFKPISILKNLLYIPNTGLLKVIFKGDIITTQIWRLY